MQVTLPEFLNCLFAEGRVRVPRPAEIPDRELRAANGVLAEFEREYRQELPGTPPPLGLPAARWAAAMFYRACQFVAFRDAGEEVMARTFAVACPPGEPPSVHYSVDLTFRYLPGLVKLRRVRRRAIRCSCTLAVGPWSGRSRRSGWHSSDPSKSAPGRGTVACWACTWTG